MSRSAALALFACAAADAFAAASGSTSAIEVRAIGQGAPVPGVVVRVRRYDGSPPEVWTTGTKIVAEDSTDAAGRILFPAIEPGRYVVVALCDRLPGDWIGGNSASVIQVFDDAPSHATLTLRRGGHVFGTVSGIDQRLAGVYLSGESPDAIGSACPMFRSTKIAPDGTFEVFKVPVGARSWIRLRSPLGDGELTVSREITLERPDSVRVTWEVPFSNRKELGQARITLRDEDGKPVHGGHVDLLASFGSSWTYKVGYAITDADTVTLASSLPPGRYLVRAKPETGSFPWWFATSDSITVEAGQTAVFRMKVRIQKS